MTYSILGRGNQVQSQALGMMKNSAEMEKQRNFRNDQMKRQEKQEKASGTISGAMAGATIGGPIGAGVGALAGYALTELF